MEKQLFSLDKAKYPFAHKANSLEIMAPIADKVIESKKAIDKAKYPFAHKANSLEIMAPIADKVIESKKAIDGEEKIVIEASKEVNLNEGISTAILDEANKQEKFDKYEKMVYLLKELKDYCVTEKELAKVEKTILKVKKKQAKYYQPTLLNSDDYKNYINRCK